MSDNNKLETDGWVWILTSFEVVSGGIAVYWLLQHCAEKGRCETYSSLPPMGEFLIPVLALGVLGGCIHGLASLMAHAGKGDLKATWQVFYIGRPFVGAGMALMTYLVLVSGVLGFKVHSELVTLAWSALAGLYSQPALDKLKEVFQSIFKTAKDGVVTPPKV